MYCVGVTVAASCTSSVTTVAIVNSFEDAGARLIKSGTVSDMPVISTDYFPTLLELAGAPQPPEQHFDGRNFAPLLRGESIARRARQGFIAIGAPERGVFLPPDQRNTFNFATLDGKSLKGKSLVVMADPQDHLGYVALPLGGVCFGSILA